MPTPTGTVTFLFTDIEGSTRRWDAQPEAMKHALTRHDAILREAIEHRGGYVFKTVGDAFHAAFATAPDALRAAVEGQRALAAEDWGGAVRMALHTGTADERDGDYFGPTLNRVARLRDVGHGGQILLSAVTAALLRGQVTDGVQLRPLGEHHLRDLTEPEQIYQACVWSLPADFPPLKTDDSGRTNLPVPLTSVIGRERETEEVAGLVQTARLVTMTGPGGTGKTRLAQAAVERVHGEYPHGVWFVDLSAVTNPSLVAATIAQTLTVREGEGQTPAEVLRAYLRAKSLLLVLDNFEQVVDAAPLLRDLLAACPRLRLLVTSRVVLHIPGEHEYSVPPLPLPDPTASTHPADLIDNPAVALFVERARSVRPDFVLTEENAGAVAEICRRLDGLPLAIELAAARTKTLSPRAMLPRLANRLALLTGGGSLVPARQQTLRGAIQWSYDLLDGSEQRLFRQMSVFAAGCTLEAAEGVCSGEGNLGVEILDGLASLVDKSLLRRQDGAGPDEPRFTMLATTREFALELACERGEHASSERRHAAYFLALAVGAEALLEQSPLHQVISRLNHEQDNLRAALAWALAHQAAQEGTAALAGLWFWLFITRPSEGLQWADAFLAMSEKTARTPARANALLVGGIMHILHGRIRQARAYLQESANIWRDVDGDERRGLALALQWLGTSTLPATEGRPLVEESVQLYRRLGRSDALMVAVLGDCAAVMLATDDPDAARPLIEEALTVARRTGDPESIAFAKCRQGWLALYEDQPTAAQAYLEAALALFQQVGDTFNAVGTQFDLGCAAVLLDDADLAARRFAELLRLAQEREHIGILADGLEGLAVLAGLGGNATLAARLFGAAETARRSVGGTMRSRYVILRAYRRRLSEIRDACIGVPGVEAAYEEGRALSLDAAVALALEQTALA